MIGRLLALLAILAMVGVTNAIYCDDDDCYDLLGLKQSATDKEIKKAYFKLSLKWHPDKNNAPEAKATFQKIAAAYEILSDEDKRRDYDYAVEHPEQHMYNQYRYYRTASPLKKVDLSVVVGGAIVLMSIFQYCNTWATHKHVMETVRRTPQYKTRLNQVREEMIREAGGGGKGKKARRDVNISEEDLHRRVGVEVAGASAASLKDVMIVRLAVLPYTIAMWCADQARWLIKYTMLRQEYEWEDAALLTRRALRISDHMWAGVPTKDQEDLVLRELWVRCNYDKYITEVRRARAQGRAPERLDKQLAGSAAKSRAAEKAKKDAEEAAANAKIGTTTEDAAVAADLASARAAEAARALQERRQEEEAAAAAAQHKAAPREGAWSKEDLDALRKLMVKFPKGTGGRWEKIAAAMGGCTSEEVVRVYQEQLLRRPDGGDAFADFLTHRQAKGRDVNIDSAPSQRDDGLAMRPGKGGAEGEGDEWSDAATMALVKAVKSFPKDTPARWDRIAAALPGRTKAQCYKRFTELREQARAGVGGGAGVEGDKDE